MPVGCVSPSLVTTTRCQYQGEGVGIWYTNPLGIPTPLPQPKGPGPGDTYPIPSANGTVVQYLMDTYDVLRGPLN